MTGTRPIRWFSGPAGATWHEISLGIARLVGGELGTPVEVVEGGGRDNPTAVQDGRADFATSVDFLCAAARRGEPPYDAPHPDLATVGVGWTALPFHLVAAPGAQELAEALRPGARSRIGVPPPSTADELTFQRLLAFAGVTYPALADGGTPVRHGSYDSLVDAFGAGEVDIVFGATGAPAAAVASMGAARPGSRVLPLPGPFVERLRSADGYERAVISAGSYPGMHEGDVATATMRTVFLVRRDQPADLVHAVTRLLLDPDRLRSIHPSLADFDPARATVNSPVPVHPGAARAYAGR